jgi:hypothetical protein
MGSVKPDPDPRTLYAPDDLDFRLKPDSATVDARCVLPNINDDFTGKAPDLGAYEVGQPCHTMDLVRDQDGMTSVQRRGRIGPSDPHWSRKELRHLPRQFKGAHKE